MADGEVPVCDVLCEAMEYLTKLGTNLRARSENLKEKRIRKDKLKNQHAVQKAADKVLLICQLSKRSLENVECGVRKVLALVSSNQAGVSADMSPSSRTSAKSDNSQYRYFKYRSHKLRVSKKVPVRHYMSVRVLARNMSFSMHDKYPVYHNCKLYRMRKKIKEKSRSKQQASESVKENNEKVASKQSVDGTNEIGRPKKIRRSEGSSHSRIKSVSSDHSEDVPLKSEDHNKKEPPAEDTEKNANDIEEEHQSTSNKKSSKKIRRSKGSNHSRTKSVCSDNSEKVSSDTENKEEKLTIGKDQENESECHKNSSGRKSRRSSHSSNSSQSKGDSNSDKVPLKRRKSSNFKKICVIDDGSSDNSNELNKRGIHTESVTDKKNSDSERSLKNSRCPSPIDKPTDELNDSDSKLVPGNEEVSESLEKNVENCSKDNKVDDGKPLIKCVSISKLLKPDVLEKKDKSPKKVENAKKTKISTEENTKVSMNKENIKSNRKQKDIEKSQSSKSDEEFWMCKRKEVSAFVAKKFVINVTRLPKLSEHFLRLYNLRKIIQSSKVICELADASSNDCTLKNVDNIPPDKINVVKNALLNDSDSEKSDFSFSKSPVPLAVIEKTVKDLLLNDSDKEKDSNDDNPKLEEDNNGALKRAEKVKDALLHDSESDNNEKSAESKTEGRRKSKEVAEESSSVHKKKTRISSSERDSDSGKNDKTNSESLISKQDDASAKTLHLSADVGDNQTPENEGDEKESELSPIKVSEKESELKSGENMETSPSKRKKHRRKHMMESIHAKKMLLTYSSSSDTEDELLRNALKEIKNSLLQAVSSSDDEKKKEKKPASSSDTEEDIMSKAKKKRKLREGSSQDSENGTAKSSEKSDANPKSSFKKVRFE